ncbi:neutral/alkaline non-lysosomal ceramidase N-terminal domain-containing protein [Chloroflexota bacterium]
MLQIGAAKVRLPMKIGQTMAGYMRRADGAIGLHDDLFVRALIATDGQEQVCLLVLDTLFVNAAFVSSVRQKISAISQMHPKSIMVTATHTHSAPAGIAQFTLDSSSESYLGTYNPDFAADTQSAVVDAAKEAIANLIPVRMYTGTGQANNVAKNRVDPHGPYDPDIPFLVAIDQDDTVVATVFSFACHSTVMGPQNRQYSGDLIGMTCLYLEEHWGAKSVTLGLAGAAGDISTRFTRKEASFAEVDRLATALSEAILGAYKQPDNDDVIDSQHRRLQLRLAPVESPTTLRKQLSIAEHHLATLDKPNASETRAIQAEIEGLEIALKAAPHRPTHVKTEVHLLQIGSALLTGFPGEMFVEYGLTVRQELQPKHVLVAGYANDYIGYVPTPESTSGYETSVAVVNPGVGQQLMNAIYSLGNNLTLKNKKYGGI